MAGLNKCFSAKKKEKKIVQNTNRGDAVDSAIRGVALSFTLIRRGRHRRKEPPLHQEHAGAGGGYRRPGWGQTPATMTDPSKQRTPSLLMWMPARAAPAAESRGPLCTGHWRRAKPAPLLLSFTLQALKPAIQLRRSNFRHARFRSCFINVVEGEGWGRGARIRFHTIHLDEEGTSARRLCEVKSDGGVGRQPLWNCFCHAFLADHMTPCCTVRLGPDSRTVPASSGVSVTSTITLLLFHSHEPLCQSSQNQTDGASWQQKACKSWIIWLEILFNYSTKWPSWRRLNARCLLYNMCKQCVTRAN